MPNTVWNSIAAYVKEQEEQEDQQYPIVGADSNTDISGVGGESVQSRRCKVSAWASVVAGGKGEGGEGEGEDSQGYLVNNDVDACID